MFTQTISATYSVLFCHFCPQCGCIQNASSNYDFWSTGSCMSVEFYTMQHVYGVPCIAGYIARDSSRSKHREGATILQILHNSKVHCTDVLSTYMYMCLVLYLCWYIAVCLGWECCRRMVTYQLTVVSSGNMPGLMWNMYTIMYSLCEDILF